MSRITVGALFGYLVDVPGCSSYNHLITWQKFLNLHTRAVLSASTLSFPGIHFTTSLLAESKACRSGCSSCSAHSPWVTLSRAYSRTQAPIEILQTWATHRSTLLYRTSSTTCPGGLKIRAYALAICFCSETAIQGNGLTLIRRRSSEPVHGQALSTPKYHHH